MLRLILLAFLGLHVWVGKAAPVAGFGLNWENVLSVPGSITDANPIPPYLIRDNMQMRMDLTLDWDQSASFTTHLFFDMGDLSTSFPTVTFGMTGYGIAGPTLRVQFTNLDSQWSPHGIDYPSSYGFPLTAATGVVTYAVQVAVTQTNYEMYVDGVFVMNLADFEYHDLLSGPVAMRLGPHAGHSWATAANFQLFYATPTLVPGIASFEVGAQSAVVPTVVTESYMPYGWAPVFVLTDSYVIEFEYTITYAAAPEWFGDDACLLCSYPQGFDFRCHDKDTGGRTWNHKRMIMCDFGVETDRPAETMVHQSNLASITAPPPMTVTRAIKLVVTQSSYQLMSDGYLVYQDLDYPPHNADEEVLLYFQEFAWISFANLKVMAATPDPSLGIAWVQRVAVAGAVTAIEPFYICDNMKVEFELSFDAAGMASPLDAQIDFVTDAGDKRFSIQFIGGYVLVYYPTVASVSSPRDHVEWRWYIPSMAAQYQFEIVVKQDLYTFKVDGEYKLFFPTAPHIVDNTPLVKIVSTTPWVTLSNFVYSSDCEGATPDPSVFPTAGPTSRPSANPTEAGCAAQGTLVHPDWQALLGFDQSYTAIEAFQLTPTDDAALLSSNVALNSGYMWVDADAVTLTIDVVLPYIGHGVAKPATETLYEYGNAYVLDFSPFESSSSLARPNSCSNRMAATFSALADAAAFWSFMDPPTSATLGTQSGGAAYGAMPPFWSVSLVDELAPCTAGIRYTGTFSFAQLQNCVDYASSTHQMAVTTSANWVNLTGAFNLDLVGTFYKLSANRNAPQRMRTLLSQPFTLAIERNLYFLASTGVQTFREAVIGVTVKDKKQEITLTLTLLSETADYLQLAPVDSVIVVNGATYAYTVYPFQDGFCLDAQANVCYQQWGVKIKIPKPLDPAIFSDAAAAAASAPAPVAPPPVPPPVPAPVDPFTSCSLNPNQAMCGWPNCFGPITGPTDPCICLLNPMDCDERRRLATAVVPTQSDCHTIDIGGEYVFEFDVSCNPAGDLAVCNQFLTVQGNSKIYISTTLSFFYSTCAPLIWEMAFQSQVLFYTALDFATPMGAADVYEVLLPVFGRVQVLLPGAAELVSVFGAHLMHMWICTVDEDAYDPSTFVLTEAEQRSGNGGCLSDLAQTPMIDTGTVYHIFDALNPAENLYAADTVDDVAGAASNEIHFTFNVPDLQNGNNRDLLFVHLQMQLDLLAVAEPIFDTETEIRRRGMAHEEDDSVSNQLYHFLVPMKIGRVGNGKVHDDESPFMAALFSLSAVTVLSVIVFLSVAANLVFCAYHRCGCARRKAEQKYAGVHNFGSSDESSMSGSGVSSNEMTETDEYDNREDEQEQEQEALRVRRK